MDIRTFAHQLNTLVALLDSQDRTHVNIDVEGKDISRIDLVDRADDGCDNLDAVIRFAKMDRTFTCTDIVDQHLLHDALHHYRFHLLRELDGFGGEQSNNPDVSNTQEWLDRTKLLEARIQKVIV